MINFLYTIIIYPIVFIIEFVFVFALELFKETGFAIICVSGVISVFCLPLYMIAEKWQTVERNLQKIFAPKIAKINAVFKGDERYMILSTFYRQNHYHPIYALRGSFGLLFQVPFFIAAYYYLSNLELLNGLSFLFIKDLSSPDALIPAAGGINLLPILMTLINCISAVVYTKGLDIKDKIQVYGITLIFFILLYNSPSALVIYWTFNNVFSLLKNIYLKLNFKYKHFILFSIISLCALILSYYSLFILINNLRVRALISILALIIAVLPWAIPFFKMLSAKIKFSVWTKKETFIIFLSSIFIIWSLTGIFTPSMLIASSPQEFSFIDSVSSPLAFIFNASLQGLGAFIFWPLIIYFLMSDKIKNVFSLFIAALSIIFLCNFFLFPGKYGTISNFLVFSENPTHNFKQISFNLFILTLFFLAVFFIYIKGFKKILSFLNISVLSAVLLISIINIVNIDIEYKKLSLYYKPDIKDNETISPIVNLSKTDNNVLIFMLDMAVSVFMPFIFDENPELSEDFEGFTYYPNTVTFNGWTHAGAPPIYGGYEYTPENLNKRLDVTFSDKYRESLLLMPRIFSESGFNVSITDPPFANDNWIPDLSIYSKDQSIKSFITDGAYTKLWLERNNIHLPAHSQILKRNIFWYSIFRALPLAFRQGIYFKGSWCAPHSENWFRTFLNGYAVLDFLPELTEFNSDNKNTVLIMKNNTTHEFLFLQAPEYRPQVNVTNYGSGPFSREIWYHVNAAAVKRLSGYFNFLKENNVYDNTRIIIVSDHGRLESTYVSKTSLPFHLDQFNPILFFKDFNGKDGMKTDMTFMSTADVPFLAMRNIIDNPVNPFTGNEIVKNYKENPLLILIKRISLKNDFELDLNNKNTYLINNNIFDEKNWIRPDALQ